MKRYGWILLSVVALVLLLVGAWLGYTGVGSYGFRGMMGGPGMMGGYGFPMMGWAGGLGMLLFWGLVIAGIVWLVRSTTQGREHPVEIRGQPPSRHSISSSAAMQVARSPKSSSMR